MKHTNKVTVYIYIYISFHSMAKTHDENLRYTWFSLALDRQLVIF